MSNKEFKRLLAYHKAKQHQPRMLNNYGGKRSIKNAAKGVGQVLVNSRVKPQVALETIFFIHK